MNIAINNEVKLIHLIYPKVPQILLKRMINGAYSFISTDFTSTDIFT